MTLKHINFFESEVMRELERQELKKHPELTQKPLSKKASALFQPKDVFDNILVLIDKLRTVGKVKEAEILQTKLGLYKTAETHLYRAIDEDGEDLLEFAHPEDVEITKSEYGKIYNPVSKHEKIIEVVNKGVSPKKKLLANISRMLGIEKKAENDGLGKLKNAAAYLIQFKNEHKHPLEFVLTVKNSVFLTVGSNQWSYSGNFGYAFWDNWNIDLKNLEYSKPNDIVEGPQWNLFKLKASDQGFDLDEKRSEFIAGRDNFRNIFIPIVDAVNKQLQSDYNGLINSINIIISSSNISEIQDSYNHLINGKWYLDFISKDKKWPLVIDNSLKIIGKELVNYKTDRINKLSKDLETKLISYITVLKQKFGNAAKPYTDKATKILNDLKGGKLSLETIEKLNTQIDSSLAGIKQVASSNGVNLKKKGQFLTPKEVAQLAASQQTIPASTTVPSEKSPTKPTITPAKPATKKTQVSQQRFDDWNRSVLEWQSNQGNNNWYKSVIAMQDLLYNLGGTSTLEQLQAKLPKGTITPNTQGILQNTGWKDFKQVLHKDGKWGPNTSAAIKEAKRILSTFGQDTADLFKNIEVPDQGVLNIAKTDEEKTKWGQEANEFISLVQRILANKGISINAQSSESSSPGAILDNMPDEPKLNDPSYPTDTDGNIQLKGTDLSSLESFDGWLKRYNMVPVELGDIFRATIQEWSIIFNNLLNRAIKKGNKIYEEAVRSLRELFREAYRKYIAANKDKKGKSVSLRALYRYEEKTQTSTTTPAGTEGESVEQLQEQQKQISSNFPIGRIIAPLSWQGYSDLQSPQFSKYINRYIDINQLQGAGSSDQIKYIIMKAAHVSFAEKLKSLRINPNTRLAVPVRGIKTYEQLANDSLHPERKRIDALFESQLVYNLIQVLLHDISVVANQYAEKIEGTNKEFAKLVMHNAKVWTVALDTAGKKIADKYNEINTGRSATSIGYMA